MVHRIAGMAILTVLLAGAAPADQVFIYQGEATSVLGRSVRDAAGDTIGRITDILVDEAGQPRAAVIDFGGFMGVGDRRIAVVWRALHFQPMSEEGKILLEMTADQIKAVPTYKPPSDAPAVTVAAPPAPAASSAPPK